MTEFDFCTKCIRDHKWIKEDYLALVFDDKTAAVELTMCLECVHIFRKGPLLTLTRHHAKIVDDFLAGKVKPRRKS